MKNKAIVGVIAAVILAGGYFITQNKDNTAVNNNQDTTNQSDINPDITTENNTEETQEQTPAQTERSGQFVDYSEEALSTTTGTKILFFHAGWCPQCVALEQDIDANGVASGVTVFKVDYDSNKDLRKKYGITIQTTLVKIDDNGDEVAKYNAYNTPNIAAVEANLL